MAWQGYPYGIPQQQRQPPQMQPQLQPQMTYQPTGFVNPGLQQPALQQQQPMFTGQPPPLPSYNSTLQPAALPNFQNSSLPTHFLGSFMPSQAPQHPPPAQPQFSAPSNLTPSLPSLQFSQPALSINHHQPVQPQNVPPPVPWALLPEERKNYDQLFRAWDTTGSGYLTGDVAKKVFGQSSLSDNDLMAIWNLADVDNRGKLNLAEFHVAMALIYRRLNGNPIPPQLPPELVPPSARDLDHSVDFLKDLLRHDTNARNTAAAHDLTGNTGSSVSYAKSRSLLQPSTVNPPRKDATMYKYDESSQKSAYKPSSRHIDRSTVRASTDEPVDDLKDMKRQLDSSQRLLDSSRKKDDDDDVLEQEKDDLMYSIRRVQSDIEHIASGRRSDTRDAERRKLERELDNLRYVELPQLEKKIEEHEREKARRKREEARRRDERNDDTYRRFGNRDRDHERDRDRDRDRDNRDRYRNDDDYRRRSRDRDDDYYRSNYKDDYHRSRDEDDYRSRDRDDRDKDDYYSRGYFKGTYDDEKPTSPRDKGYGGRDRSYSQASRPSRPSSAAPPPPPPPVSSAPPVTGERVDPPSATSVPSRPASKNMTPEERQAYMKSEAQRRIQERLRALGVSSTPTTPTDTVDDSVSRRLEEDRKAAVERAAQADAETAQREKERQERLQREKMANEDIKPSKTKQSESNTAIQEERSEQRSIQKQTAEVEEKKDAIHKVQQEVSDQRGMEAKYAQEQLEKEKEEMQKRENEILRRKQESEARLKKLEEEYEASKRAEEEFLKSKQMWNKKEAESTPPKPPASRSTKVPPPPPSRSRAAPPPPPSVKKAPPRPPSSPSFDAPLPRVEKPVSPPKPKPSTPKAPPPPARSPVPSKPDESDDSFEAPPPPPPPRPTVPTVAVENKPANPPTVPAPQVIAENKPDSAPSPPDDVRERSPQPEKVPQPAAAAPSGSSSTNPFHRLPSGTNPTPATSQNNPFFRKTASATPAPDATPAPRPPSPPAAASSDDWDAPSGNDSSDEDDDDNSHMSRKARAGLASALFGGPMPPSRPASTNPTTSGNTPTASATPTAPKPSADSDSDDDAPPPPPSAPSAPVAPAASAPAAASAAKSVSDQNTSSPAPAPSADIGALLGQIQMGKKLKKTVTNDRSTSIMAGAVVDDGKPMVPPQDVPTSTQRPRDEHEDESHAEVEENQVTPVNDNRQSVDWYGRLAAEGLQKSHPAQQQLPSFKEEEEEQEQGLAAEPTAMDNGESDVDFTKQTRSRTLYPYFAPAERPNDLTCEDNLVIVVHPALSNDDWVYGILDIDGRKGWLPASYVQGIENSTSATAIYEFQPTTENEMELVPGKAVTVVDKSEQGWWKIVEGPRIGIVPASYLETAEGSGGIDNGDYIASHGHETEQGQIMSPNSVDISNEEDNSSAMKNNKNGRMEEISDGNDEDSSSSDDEPAIEDEERRKEKEAQRIKVLEAAGLLRKPTVRKLRAPPSKPDRPTSIVVTNDRSSKVLLDTDSGNTSKLPGIDYSISSFGKTFDDEEDAYQRYERLRREQPPPAPSRQSLEVIGRHPDLPLLTPLGSSSGKDSRSDSPRLGDNSSGTSVNKLSNASNSHGGFLNWVASNISWSSLSSSSTPIERKSTPSIVRIDDASSHSGESGSKNAYERSSWASHIDPTVVKELPDRERKRQESIWELIQTESSYLQSLQLMMEVFCSKLQDVLSEEATKVIFANIDDILLFNTVFFSDLEDRLKESRLFVDQIADVILKHMSKLDLYWFYCSNEANANKTLADLKAQDEDVSSILEITRVNDLELEHFLLEPMQRLTRYPLLFSQILKYTDAEHADYRLLKKCIAKAEKVLAKTNETIRENEDEERLAALSDKLKMAGAEYGIDLTSPPRLHDIGRRRLIREGGLTKGVRQKKLDAYLFNDMILLAVGNDIYKDPIPLEECSIRDKSLKDDQLFHIKHRGSTLYLRAPSARLRRAWVADISKARNGCLLAVKNEQHRWSQSISEYRY